MSATALAGRPVSGVDVGKIFYKDGVGFRALGDVNFNIEAGSFVSIIGPSGCGKSTLLRLIAGLEKPTHGELRVGGQPVQGPDPVVGLMLQSPTLFPWRTVRSNILLPIEIRGRVSDEHVRSANDLIELVGLDGFEGHYPKELSGGMQQRVALSRLLIIDPDVMLLDEPFGALDEFTRERLNLELAEIVSRTGKTVILVTHSITEAVFLSDWVLPMTSAPGCIAAVIDVPFERPRPTSVMRTEEFNKIVFDVRRALDVEETG